MAAMPRFVVIALLLVSWPASSRAAEKGLEERLLPYIRAHKGVVALGIKHLELGESYYFNPDQPMPTASLIKFPILLELYLQMLEGKLKLTEMVTLRETDKVQGSGILTYHFSAGATFSLRDTARLMMVFSDNTATNMVLDRIGLASTNKRMELLGCPETRVNAKVFRGSTSSVDPERTKRFGLGSTTAREMVGLLEKVERRQVATTAACKEMLDHMKRCEDKTKLKRFLPDHVAVAHKSGYVSDIKTDAGILYLAVGPVAVCVLTGENEDRSWRDDNDANVLIGRVAREAHDYFMAKGAAKSAVKGAAKGGAASEPSPQSGKQKRTSDMM